MSAEDLAGESPSAPPEPALRSAFPADIRPATRPLRLVIADGSVVARAVMADELSRDHDLEVVETVSTGVDAVEAVRSHLPGLAVLDIAMPLLDGFEATRRILAEVPTTVALVTGEPESPGLLARARRAGAKALLQKPAAEDHDAWRRLRRRLRALGRLRPFTDPEAAMAAPRLLEDFLPRVGKGEHVLLVEDSATQATVLRDGLQASGFRVSVTGHAVEAWSRFVSGGVKAVVTDLRLGTSSGFDLIRFLRTVEGGHRLPILAVSARSEPVDLLELLEAGASEYLCKPVSPRQVVTRLAELLAESPPQQGAAFTVSHRGRRFEVRYAPGRALEFMARALESVLQAQGRIERERLIREREREPGGPAARVREEGEVPTCTS